MGLWLDPRLPKAVQLTRYKPGEGLVFSWTIEKRDSKRVEILSYLVLPLLEGRKRHLPPSLPWEVLPWHRSSRATHYARLRKCTCYCICVCYSNHYPYRNYNLVTWFLQPCNTVIGLLQGCYKVVTRLFYLQNSTP